MTRKQTVEGGTVQTEVQSMSWVTLENTSSPASYPAQEEMRSRELQMGAPALHHPRCLLETRLRICTLTRFPSDFDAH